VAWPRFVDAAPYPKLAEEGRPNKTFEIATSDAFFERPENRVRAQGSQRALIDDDHSLAKALRDFENLKALAAPNSIIAIHDVVPDDMDARVATSKAETAFHTDWRTASGGSRIGTISTQRRGDRLSILCCTAYVCFWHKADIAERLTHVRY